MDEKEPSQDEFSSTRWDFLAPAAAGAIAIAGDYPPLTALNAEPGVGAFAR